MGARRCLTRRGLTRRLEKDAKIVAARKKIGGDAGGKSGGLKRLNFQLARADEKPETKTQKFHMEHIDAHIKKEEEELAKVNPPLEIEVGKLGRLGKGKSARDQSTATSGTKQPVDSSKVTKRWQLAGSQIRSERQKTTKNFTMKDRRGASVDEVAGVLDDEQRDRGE